MADILKLKEKVKESDMSIEELAEKIGINRSTMYRKIAKDGEVFTLREVKEISRVLMLTQNEAVNIFFAQVVA